MTNPLYDMLNGRPQQTPQNNYLDILTRANQMAQNLPQNFNPQAIIQGMVNSGQVSQQQLNQAMQIANQLTGRR